MTAKGGAQVGGPEFYTPPIPEPVKASEGTFVPNRMENDAVMRRVSRDLYASPTAGVRELLANEITAARAAKKLGANPHIHGGIFTIYRTNTPITTLNAARTIWSSCLKQFSLSHLNTIP